MADIEMPQLGETVTEGTITKWFKEVGDQVAEDEGSSRSRPTRSTPRCPRRWPACSPRSRCPRARPSTSAPCSPSLGDGDGAAPAAAPAAEAAAARAGRRAAEPAAEPEPAAGRGRARRSRAGRRARAGGTAARAGGGARQRRGRRRRATARVLSPVVRRLIDEHGLDPATHHGHRLGGRITRDDVERAAAESGAGSAPRGAGRPGAGGLVGSRRRSRGGDRPGAGAAADRRHRRAAQQHPPPHRRAHGAVQGRPRPTCSPSIEVDYEDVERVRRRPPGRVARPRRASASPTCRSSPGPSSTPSREFPHINAIGRRRRAHRAQLRQPRHRRRPRLRGPAGAGRARRRRQAPAGHRPRDQRPRRPGPAPKKLSADDIAGGTFTITNSGPYGTLPGAPDHQPAAGGDPLDRRRAPQAGRGHRRRRHRGHRHPLGRHPRPELGPPGLRRRLRRRLPAPR